MSDPDRLASIEEHLKNHQDIHEDDGWWLLGQVDRLRDLLARLEWAGGKCPACGTVGHLGLRHAPDCWLAAALHPERETTRSIPLGG
jgi:hypothetical protein